jgi:hypothetical protein
MKLVKSNLDPSGIVDTIRANSTVGSLECSNCLHLLVSAGEAGSISRDIGPVTVHTRGGRARASKGGIEHFVLLQMFHCLTEARKPPCLSSPMLKALNEIRGNSDLLRLFEEDQLANGAPADSMDARKQAFDPGWIECAENEPDEIALLAPLHSSGNVDFCTAAAFCKSHLTRNIL